MFMVAPLTATKIGDQVVVIRRGIIIEKRRMLCKMHRALDTPSLIASQENGISGQSP